MRSASTIRKRLNNNHYEQTLKKLQQVEGNADLWSFINSRGEAQLYSICQDAIFDDTDKGREYIEREYRRTGLSEETIRVMKIGHLTLEPKPGGIGHNAV